MSDLVVFAFDNETGAAEMAQAVKGLQKQELIQIEDAATVVRKQDGKPKVKQAQSLVGAGALGGAFWGLLIGLLFFAPWLGMVAGALGGAIGGKLTCSSLASRNGITGTQGAQLHHRRGHRSRRYGRHLARRGHHAGHRPHRRGGNARAGCLPGAAGPGFGLRYAQQAFRPHPGFLLRQPR